MQFAKKDHFKIFQNEKTKSQPAMKFYICLL
jgi:hypothetical protein